MRKKVIILGSTGSIGRNAVKVINSLPDYKIIGIAGYSRYQTLAKQARLIKPKAVNIIEEQYYRKIKGLLPNTKIFCGEQGITDMIDYMKADVIICAFARAIGIFGIIKAIEKRMRVCLATKEILVSFGDAVMNKVKQCNTELIPIDSEHSGVYQCLEGRSKKDIKSIILTASGGPFLNRSILNVTKDKVLKHPVWKMGAKITVDSATMMNKGLEVIEAHHLFQIDREKIKVVVHPEAICHSLVQFNDGILIAQLSTPDMRLPIQYALTAPRRRPSKVKYLDIRHFCNLTFLPPNLKKFPCLQYAYDALKIGKSMPAVLNAANEEAVKLFLEDRIKFHQIPMILRKVLSKHSPYSGDISAYIEAEQWSRETVRSLVC